MLASFATYFYEFCLACVLHNCLCLNKNIILWKHEKKVFIWSLGLFSFNCRCESDHWTDYCAAEFILALKGHVLLPKSIQIDFCLICFLWCWWKKWGNRTFMKNSHSTMVRRTWKISTKKWTNAYHNVLWLWIT